MITPIDRKTLNNIQNKHFYKDAERYVEIYENFISDIADSGIQIQEKASSSVFTSYDRLKDVPGIITGNSGHSLSYGHISPACLHCRTGEGSKTVFHTLKCNRDCYFCANMNQENYDYYVKNINNAFEELSVTDKGGGFKSIALTGGEPLLLPGRAVDFFKECRSKYPEAHLRLYSNGDFLTDKLATALADAGVDEIRISVKAADCGYPEETVEKVALAAKYIPSAMVEMPVIPGTLEVMKRLFTELESAGCKGINILEFLYPWINNQKFKSKGFKIKNRPYKVLYDYGYAGGLPIAGSAEECLTLMEYAAEKKMKMGVHYCSLENKLTAQVYGQNANTKLMPYEVMSEKDFFFKTARAYGSDAAKVIKYMKKINCDQFFSEDNGTWVEFHPKYLEHMKGLSEAALTYNIVENTTVRKALREIKIDLVKPEEFVYSEDI